MKNRPRPYIPLPNRCNAAGQQLMVLGVNVFAWYMRDEGESLGALLHRRLAALAGKLGAASVADLHLDHNPPLRARPYNPRIKDIAARYTPNANDPAYLIYRTATDHRMKTNVRGDGAQFPDRVLIKRERRRERGHVTKRTINKLSKTKRAIPQRRDPWPKDSRKINSRKTL